MSSNILIRIAGIAGILLTIKMIVDVVVGDASKALPLGVNLLHIIFVVIFVVGLYLLYRDEQPALSMAALVLSLIGQLFMLIFFLTYGADMTLLYIEDFLLYIVGMSLFSWLAYRTRKMPRPLPIIGFLGALAGVASYVLVLGTGADPSNPNTLMIILFLLYLILVVVWLAWTSISLLLTPVPAAAPRKA